MSQQPPAKVPLAELYEFRSGLSKPRSAFGSGDPFLTFKDVFYNFFVPDELGDLVESTEKERISCDIKRGDVFLTRTSETQGDLGMSTVALKDYPRATFNGFSKRLRPRSDNRIIPEYAGYFFRGRAFRIQVAAMSSLSTRASLNEEMLNRFHVLLPEPHEQKAIARVLKGLDDKIETNRRMNAVLEEMARAIFRAWFVDFEPVKAKAAGASSFPGMPQETFDQLPNRLAPSELGEIPEGWEVKPLDQLVEINPKRVMKKGELAPYLSMQNMPTAGHAPEDWEYREFGSGMRFKNGDTLVARITPCLENGKTALVDFLPDEIVAWGSTEYIVMSARPPHSPAFAYCLARSPRFREFAISNMTGTSGRQRVPASVLQNFRMAGPCEAVAETFAKITESLFARIAANMNENRDLAATRDVLLPKLISGELTVPAAADLAAAS